MKRFLTFSFTLALIFSFVLTLSSCSINISLNYKDADKYKTGKTSLNPTENVVEGFEIEWINGDVEISYYDGSEITLEESSSRSLEEHELVHYYFDGDILHIKYAKSGTWQLNKLTKTLRIKIPKEFKSYDFEINSESADIVFDNISASEIEIETASGNTKIDGGNYKEISISSVSGELSIKDAAISNLLYAELVSGAANVKLSSPILNADIQTVSGKIKLISERVSDLELETTSGSIDARLNAIGPDTKFESVSGNIGLTLKKNTSFSLEFDTVSGKFDSDIATTKKGDTYIAGDGYPEIEVETVSGKLDINAEN